VTTGSTTGEKWRELGSDFVRSVAEVPNEVERSA
jgi:hypothetical protein